MFFWTVPSNQNEIITNTPVEAKSVRYLFFENKNGQMFSFGDITDCITISIDNKAICRDLLLLPYCTENSDRLHCFDWQEVALFVGLNVNNSQVKISGLRDNDVNIVFVCDTQEIQQYKGVDFIENKIIRLRQPEDSISYIAPNPPIYSKLAPYIAKPNEEMVLSFDEKPIGFFVYPFYTRMDNRVLPFATDRKIWFDIGGTETQVVPDAMEMFPFSATAKIPWSKCAWKFDSETARSLLLKLTYNTAFRNQLRQDELLDSNNNPIKTIDLAFSFFYKKI